MTHGHGHDRELPDLKDAPTPILTSLAGMCLGMMFCWLISVILFAAPPRYSGLRPEVMTLLVVGAVVGLVLGFLAFSMMRGGSNRRARPTEGGESASNTNPGG